MGRVGKKKKMKIVRNALRSYDYIANWEPHDLSGYDQLCELDKLKSIPNIFILNPEQEYIREIALQIRKGNGVEREMPDIGGEGFGIEHTEVFPFFRHKKGDNFRRFKTSIAESKRTIPFDSFELFYLDLPSFFKKLGILSRSQFKENIVHAIKEKSNKFEKYEHFKFNGLWLDYPAYISFPESNVLAYFMQEDIYNALNESPFDFFIIGNANTAAYISKSTLNKLNLDMQPINHFYLGDCDQKDFTVFTVRAKKAQRMRIGFGDVKNGMVLASEDMYIRHVSHIHISLPDAKRKPVETRLYFDDLLAEVTSLDKDVGVINITFVCEGIEGELDMNFEGNLCFSLSNIPLEVGETMSLHVCQHDEKSKQKIITGIKRLVLDYGNKIDIYITPPHDKLNLEDIQLIRTEDLAETEI
ncbi:hypothetical protein OKZ58_002463 [Vibrio alginolyticus]|nr:hypothetical protein [Vibrio alginolyticus]